MADDDAEAPGWHAIDLALAPIYNGEEPPFHYARPLHAVLGGPDPLDGISVYRNSTFGSDHWHFVTYGFSELYAKETADPQTSGYGFELTFRLVSERDESRPPSWALSFLQNMARYVFTTGNIFENNHCMNLNSPIAYGSSTAIRAIVFTHDPQLPHNIDTPNGTLSFLQVVGVTLDESVAIKRWDAEKFLVLFEDQVLGGLTNLNRQSVLSDPAFTARVTAGTQADGSSTEMLFPSVATYVQSENSSRPQLRIVFGANGLRDLLQVFPYRLPFQRDLTIIAGETVIRFRPAPASTWRILADKSLEVCVSREFATEFTAVLRVQAGEYAFRTMPDMQVSVEKSAIKDRDGNIVEWVG